MITAPTIQAVIVDDEPLARDCVRLALEQHADLHVIAECEQGESAVEAIRQLAPDLVFLDVQMPGLDGFGVIERVGVNRMPPVVFVTAYDAHALRAFQVHALDYVLKPFDDARFAEALRHAREQIRLRRDGELGRRLAALLSEMRDPARLLPAPTGDAPDPITRITVREADRVHFVRVADVDYFEGAGNYIRLRVAERAYRIRATLSGLMPRLDPAHFVRIHRSVIVNVERIREVQPWFGGDYIAILTTGQRLRVSRTYAQALLRPMR